MPSANGFDPGGINPARRARLAAALPLLADARHDATALGGDAWQLSVTSRELTAAGMTVPDLRWLVAFRLAEHAHERPHSRERRRFVMVARAAVTEVSCFLLTEAGAALAAGWLTSEAPGPRPDPANSAPRWDPVSRELIYCGAVVKRLARPAACQERILGAFEEEGWPRRIYDPLGPAGGSDPHQRLHDAVRHLNRQAGRVRVRFWRDGSGEGVCWSGRP